MNKITFNYTHKDGRTSFWLSVTVIDGKVSIKGLLGGYTSAAERGQAKAAVLKVIENKDWTNPAVSGFHEASLDAVPMIVSKLKEQTQDIKQQYLDASKEYAIREYNKAVEFLKKPSVERPERQQGQKMNDWLYSDEYLAYERNNKARAEAKQIVSASLDSHIENELKWAEIKYNNATEKLADRIRVIDLDVNKMTITRGGMDKGGNLGITITDGEKSVRAFTILAWGMIVRPHYRYLIK